MFQGVNNGHLILETDSSSRLVHEVRCLCSSNLALEALRNPGLLVFNLHENSVEVGSNTEFERKKVSVFHDQKVPLIFKMSSSFKSP